MPSGVGIVWSAYESRKDIENQEQDDHETMRSNLRVQTTSSAFNVYTREEKKYEEKK